MTTTVVKHQFSSRLVTGVVAAVLCFVIALLVWPLWGTVSKSVIHSFASTGLAETGPKAAAAYYKAFAEATFFWIAINSWIWQSLIFLGYGKHKLTLKQPWAGIWYSAVSVVVGVLGFLVLVGFSGLFWKSFSFGILFTPQTAEQVKLATEGWEASNFYSLSVILVQIPFTSLLHRWPFAHRVEAPWDGFGTFMFSSYFVLLGWFAMIVPHWLKLAIGEEIVVNPPMGNWASFAAVAQCFIWWAILPAEGAEWYPMKLFAKKQPLQGMIGILITLVMGTLTFVAMRAVIHPMNLLPANPADPKGDLPVASVMLSIIVATLLWHHLFDDFPAHAQVRNTAARVLSRVTIWWVLGFGWGLFWVKNFTRIPFAGGTHSYPVMGILAGQFVLLMAFLFFNTHFEKWPLVRRVRQVETTAPAVGLSPETGKTE